MYEGANGPRRGWSRSALASVHTVKRRSQQDDPLALLSSGQPMRLARAFAKIADGRIRVVLVSLAEGIASEAR